MLESLNLCCSGLAKVVSVLCYHLSGDYVISWLPPEEKNKNKPTPSSTFNIEWTSKICCDFFFFLGWKSHFSFYTPWVHWTSKLLLLGWWQVCIFFFLLVGGGLKIRSQAGNEWETVQVSWSHRLLGNSNVYATLQQPVGVKLKCKKHRSFSTLWTRELTQLGQAPIPPAFYLFFGRGVVFYVHAVILTVNSKLPE